MCACYTGHLDDAIVPTLTDAPNMALGARDCYKVKDVVDAVSVDMKFSDITGTKYYGMTSS